MQDIQVLSPGEMSGSPQENYEMLLEHIVSARQNIGLNFMTLGKSLDVIQSQELYRNGGFRSFQAFLRSNQVNIALPDAERFMAMTRDPAFERNLNMGLSKMLELMKLPEEQRAHLLSEGATINGQHKDIQTMNLKEMRQATQALKREGKSRCDRCHRWVDEVRELDGKQFGHGADHTCYSQEIEDRQGLTANSLPPDKLSEVLNIIKDATAPHAVTELPDAAPLQWLPESLYQMYGQLLYAQQQSGGEVTVDALNQEQEMLGKLMHLCKNRLAEIKEMSKALKALTAEEMPAPAASSAGNVPGADEVPW